MTKSFRYPTIWLALSGGGTRAALFHYGFLKRLWERGLLHHIHSISASSGGAITAALLGRSARVSANLESIDYDFPAFEAAVLRVAGQGLLGLYFAHIGLGCLSVLLFGAGVFLRLCGSVARAGLLRRWSVAAPGFLIGSALTLSTLVIILARQHLKGPNRRHPAGSSKHSQVLASLLSLSLTFVRSLLSPSLTFVRTLDALAFQGAMLGALPFFPRIYLNSVNLETGRQAVFTKGAVTDGLGPSACRLLWEQRADTLLEVWFSDFSNVSLAESVAASAAYLPFLPGIPIATGREPVGETGRTGVAERKVHTFVDGGFLDNLAMKVPEALALHVSARRNRYISAGAFEHSIRGIVFLDATMPVERVPSRRWYPVRSLWRLTEALAATQRADAENMAAVFETVHGIPTIGVTLRQPLPRDPWFDQELNACIRRIRSHFDSFSREECAVIAYCGYYWSEVMIRDGWLSTLAQEASFAPFLYLSELLPRGEDPATQLEKADLLRHFRYSHRTSRFLRWTGRRLGL